jgi:Protein of unknown function (DUF3347)
MKMIRTAIFFAFAAINIAACNGNEKTNETEKGTAVAGSSADPASNTTTTVNFPISEVVAGYLKIKNALVKESSQEAANAGKELSGTLSAIDIASLSQDQARVYQALQGDLKEHSDHIATNSGKIDHQRSHFEMLGLDIADLIKGVGNAGQTLYKDFCPMANDGKGAVWLSESKEIKNPYMGKKMMACGVIKDTIK